MFSKEYTRPYSNCKGYKYWTSFGYEYGCEYNTILSCDECKYCGGKKNPNAKCNQVHE
jgi:hypothetical protein